MEAAPSYLLARAPSYLHLNFVNLQEMGSEEKNPDPASTSK